MPIKQHTVWVDDVIWDEAKKAIKEKIRRSNVSIEVEKFLAEFTKELENQTEKVWRDTYARK